MSPYETGDIHVESEGIAASDRHFTMCTRKPDVCQSRGAARPIASACQAAQIELSARQRSGSGTRQPRPPQPRRTPQAVRQRVLELARTRYNGRVSLYYRDTRLDHSNLAGG